MSGREEKRGRVVSRIGEKPTNEKIKNTNILPDSRPSGDGPTRLNFGKKSDPCVCGAQIKPLHKIDTISDCNRAVGV